MATKSLEKRLQAVEAAVNPKTRGLDLEELILLSMGKQPAPRPVYLDGEEPSLAELIAECSSPPVEPEGED